MKILFVFFYVLSTPQSYTWHAQFFETMKECQQQLDGASAQVLLKHCVKVSTGVTLEGSLPR